MPRVRRNEWNFAANAAAIISELLRDEAFADSALGHAESELTEGRGARRNDLVIFSRTDPTEPLITGELKVPWSPEGRTPYNTSVVEDAYSKAGNAGARYFITWNIRRIVLWKTDDPGVQLINRVVYDQEIISREIENQEALSRPEFQEELRLGIEAFLRFLASLLAGLYEPHYLPIDRIFIARLEAALDHPISATIATITDRFTHDNVFRLKCESWMRDEQGWLVTSASEAENITRAARFTCYVFVNRLCFYNALRRKYEQLPRLTATNNISTGQMLERRLDRAFADARRFTGDYDSVFDGDFGDKLPFLSDEAVPDWREMIRLLDNYDFAHIDVDVIGAMYERLITPAERHRYGQHYTQPRVVDLMTALSIEAGDDIVLDPGCGGGTFLVGAYKRKSILDPALEHSEILARLYGCDILHYACHLTTINLAIRDLIDDDNFPRVHRGDFLDYVPGQIFSSQPTRLQAGGLPTGVENSCLAETSVDVVIGNPPYINAREMTATAKSRYLSQAQRTWPHFDWKRSSDIYVYFWLHAARFLRNDGRLILLTQSGWLDGDFGIPLQEWMLANFSIEAVIETDAEPWFTDARVATCITVLRRVNAPVANHLVRFVQLSEPLEKLFALTEIKTPSALAETITGFIDIPGFSRTRAVPQRQLADDGRNEHGVYIGSRWGRHLRTPDSLYGLYARHMQSFTTLSGIAEIKRGITTNCDDFFLVENISDDVLARVTSATSFREFYGVTRRRVEEGEVKIIRRKDGVEFALPSVNLTPILKTARDFQSMSTALLPGTTFAVCFGRERTRLTPLAQNYILAGEREGWHRTPSFAANRSSWFVLRSTDISPILFPKTSQYIPVVLLNDAGLLANQRLYEIRPVEGIDPLALWAALNSSLFAFERYTTAKSLGREAAIDVEVFTAEAFRIPDLRDFNVDLIGRLRRAAETLIAEGPTAAIDESLMELGQTAAIDYLSRTPVDPASWPSYMSSASREAIDLALLEGLGMDEATARETRIQLCNDLLTYTRKLKVMEFQAQENRRGTPSNKISAGDVATAVLQQVISDRQLTLRRIPQDFIPASVACATVLIPSPGKLVLAEPDLFGGPVRGKIRGHNLAFANSSQAALVALLAKHGLSGSFSLPADAAECEAATSGIEEYLSSFADEIDSAVANISTDVELQARVLKEGMNRVIHSAD